MSKWYNKVLEVHNIVDFNDNWTNLLIVVKSSDKDYDFYNKLCSDYVVIKYLYLINNNNKEYVYKHLFLLSVIKTKDKLNLNFHQNECDERDRMNIMRYIKLNKLRSKIK